PDIGRDVLDLIAKSHGRQPFPLVRSGPRKGLPGAYKKSLPENPGGSDRELVQTPSAGASIGEMMQSCQSAQRAKALRTASCHSTAPRLNALVLLLCSYCHHSSSDLVMSTCSAVASIPPA